MKILELFFADNQLAGRQKSQELYLDFGGVVGDKFYNKKIDRSILITGLIAYEMAKDEGIELKFGDLGENILVDFDTRLLKSGERLISKDIILEVTKPCTICQHLSIYDSKLPMLIKETRGVYLKVINGGTIKKGDELIVQS